MTIPTDLQHDPNRRGPYGTDFMGVSTALPLQEVTHDDGQPWDQAEWRAFIQYAQPQMLEMLRIHVGGAQPAAEPQFSLDGPHDDPIQGPIYVMTAGAWVNPLSLPVDCPAYRAIHAPEAGR